MVICYIFIWLIEFKKCANFRIEVNGWNRRLQWESVPRCINEDIHSAIMESDCMIFGAAFPDDAGNLGINVIISKFEDSIISKH